MPKSLSMDLRTRVVGANADGASRRRATARFGVSFASAIRWQSLVQSEGDPSPKPQGGHQRSHLIEAHSAAILKILAEKDYIILDELQERLASQGIQAARHFGVFSSAERSRSKKVGACKPTFKICVHLRRLIKKEFPQITQINAVF